MDRTETKLNCDTRSLNNLKTWKNHVKVRDLCKNLILSNSELKQFMKRMSCSIDQGLGKVTHPTATIKCLQTYVQDLPTGNEKGEFLALDLGGSNFRVLKLYLNTNNNFKMIQETYTCSKDLITGSGEKLFDYIANCLKQFVNIHKIKSTSAMPLGFTFSFPMSQSSIDSGKLLRWTKGFTCDGVVNEDIVQLLTKSINKIGDLNIKVYAILNDTVGTLMSCAWIQPKTKIGLIIGTGCNSCYVEKVSINSLYLYVFYIFSILGEKYRTVQWRHQQKRNGYQSRMGCIW